MIRLLLLISLLLLCALSAGAQGLSLNVAALRATGTAASVFSSGNARLSNTSGRAMRMKVMVTQKRLPAGWSYNVCINGDCFSGLSEEYVLAAGEQADLQVQFEPNGFGGSGSMDLLLYSADNGNIRTNTTVSAFAEPPAGAGSASGYKIFPNPATDYFQVEDMYGKVARVEIYNVMGKKIDSYEARGANTQYPVEQLNRGLYLVRLVDRNGNILFTQRISKSNP